MWDPHSAGVSKPQHRSLAGQSMPHCDGCSARGPDVLRVFSNCDETRVIMPSAEMYDSRESTCAHAATHDARARASRVS